MHGCAPGHGHSYLRVSVLLVGCDPHILREAVSGAARDPASSGNVSYLLTAKGGWMWLLTLCNTIPLFIYHWWRQSFDAYYVSTLPLIGCTLTAQLTTYLGIDAIRCLMFRHFVMCNMDLEQYLHPLLGHLWHPSVRER